MPREKLKPWEYAGLSPTQRCYRWLEHEGYVHSNASGFNFGSGKRWDTFGCIDFWAWTEVGTQHGHLIGIQTTSGPNHSSHKKKMLDNEWVPRLLKSGVGVWLFTWSDLKDGWTPRIEKLTLDMFDTHDEGGK